MKRSYIIAGVFIILASTFVIEYYTNTRFPTQEYPLVGVPELVIGETHTFSYFKELERVGNYSYTITEKSGDQYTLISDTDVRYEGERIHLECSFVFDEHYNPEEYMLMVDQGGETNIINVTFTSGNVVTEVFFNNETITLSEEFPYGAFLTENNMPGIWEILLISGDLELGARYSAQVYIPQGGTMFDLEFYVQGNPQSITIGDEQLSCIVIQESNLDLRFYLYEGGLVQMKNDDQDLLFTIIS